MVVEIEGVNSDIKGDAKLWRYMDFTKLVSMLSTQSIYFCRSDEFKDVFEGVIFGYEVETAREDLENVLSEFGFSEQFKANALRNPEKYKESVLKRSEVDRKNVFINCWHLNDYESAAMWDLYLKSNEGIAIQTTFDRVKQSLNVYKEDIYIGKVKYIDHTKQKNLNKSFLEPFFTKRISFKHEQEVRLVYALTPFHEEYDENPDEKGKNVQVDLTNLIECVYVSPDAAPWFVEVVKVILEKFNIDTKVIHSDLYKVK
ncbi:DUF2971 domain-containing protein [Bacillus thuringiensis]|uniref:DUF2971 domain-containing protein n=1 Tax=Bacillus thuringiensis TaxID=1428 RepID=UPI000BF8EA46|nr:DUF2971 domain-containing protein [Bacillus thuringiensis]PFS65523.1 hypothetical protein COK87_01935 [Bacillus thuringiensis]